MPPKAVKMDKGQQKALEKQKTKIAEDKTFGLKNKNKSKTVQKYIKGVQAAAKGQAGLSEAAQKQKEYQQKEEKKKEAQQAALMASLLRDTKAIKKAEEEKAAKSDPTSIKEGQQIDLYTDQREQKKNETMDDWDQAKLEEVIRTKHGTHQAKPTDIVCKYFLDALEKRQYGWFWTCPSGGDTCKYRHCLPPGFVLKRDVPKDALDEEDAEPLEEIIERRRAELKGEGTKVTLETFLAWKEKKEKDRVAAVEAARVAESKRTGDRGLAIMSGRDLFAYDPTLFTDDAAAADEDDYDEEASEDRQRSEEEADSSSERSDSDYEDSDDADRATSSQPAESLMRDISCDGNDPAPRKAPDVSAGKEQLFLEGDVPDLDELSDFDS